MTLRAIIYARVSKPGEKSVTDQEKVGRRDLASIGAEVVAVYTDKQSASRYRRVAERPGFLATLKRARAGDIDLVWSFAGNRAHRDLDDYVDLRRLCIDTRTLWRYGGRTYDMTVPADRRATNADAIRAEEFGDDLSEATRRGVQEALEDGRAHGKLPRGYRIVRDSTTGEPLRREAIPEQAEVIREAARRALNRERMMPLAASLEQRWRAAGGTGVWSGRTLRLILINPTYAGLRTSAGQVAREGKWEPILTVEQHEQLHSLLTDPGRRTSDRGPKTAYLLSYIAECGVCGGPMSPKLPVRNRPRSVHTYRCKAGHCSRSMAVVDAFVQDVLLSLLEDPAVEAKLSAPLDESGPSLEDVLAEVKRLEDAKLTWLRDAARGGLSALAVKTYEAEVDSQIAEVRARVTFREVDPLLRDLVGAGVRDRWKVQSLERKRQVLRSCVSVIIYPTRNTKELTGVEVFPIGALA
ncbi:recombinase family protein [Nocardia sp. NPDC050697]|uniref:recombinase family protein n=1 Tax=Nocardia sp. NPDC050697 TaxID=3155158 RepID=UPI00340017EF